MLPYAPVASEYYTYRLYDDEFEAIVNVRPQCFVHADAEILPRNSTRLLHTWRHESVEVKAIIQEYTERKLNVVRNLVRYFQWYEKSSFLHTTMLEYLKWMEDRNCPVLTPELKQQLNKYAVLI